MTLDTTYTVASLTDIANLFDEKAKSLRGLQDPTIYRVRDRLAHWAAAEAWEQAASILRCTTIK